MAFTGEQVRQLLAASKIALRGADLSGADLSHFDLRDVDLSFAKLKNAKLQGTLMNDGTILEGADIDGADFTGAQASLGASDVLSLNAYGINGTSGKLHPLAPQRLREMMVSKGAANFDSATFDNSVAKADADRKAAADLRKLHQSGELQKLHQQANGAKVEQTESPEYARTF